MPKMEEKMDKDTKIRWENADSKERRRLFRVRGHCEKCGEMVLPVEREIWLNYRCSCGNVWLSMNHKTSRRIAEAIRSIT